MTNTVSSSLLLALRRVAADQHRHDLSDQELLDRFERKQDESAFHVLLQRHGPMVLDVCRALLPSQADAEDAFQATFLALARQAGSIRRTASLAGWLYGVAARTAHKARAGFSRRRKHERQAARSEESAAEDLTWREVQQVLHEELSQLSERYRLPLVLCYLQGRTLDDVAGQLGVARNTLKTRLERGREVLRARLLRRGLGPTAVLLASAWPASARAYLSAGLVSSTTTAALGMATGQAAGLISARVAALTEGVSNTMWVTCWKIIAAAATVLACVGLGFGGLAYTRPAEKPAGAAAEQVSVPAAATPRPATEQKAIAALQAVGGRIVFDKSQPGEPVVGVYLLSRQVTDRDFVHLREFKSLKTLVVPGLSAAAMKEVHGLKSLERLRARPEIKEGVKDLGGLRELRELDLEGFDEEGLVGLRGLKHLHTLRLTPWRAAGKGLKELREVKELRRLELGFVFAVPQEERHVEAVLSAWSELPHLEELVLETRIDDAALTQIAQFKSLRMLRLANNKVTDAGLAELKSLKTLRRLSLWHTSVTDAGVADLVKARPDLEVTKDVRDDPPKTWSDFQRITGKVKVLDAKTLLFDDGTRIPLNMVAPVGREKGAREAADFLAQLVRDRTVNCFLVEAQLAYIGYVGDVNIEHAMIIHGWARSHHSGTKPAEAIAQENQRGLWGRKFQGLAR
jgi:RNA polymerase sigma factor (sigma-70 family)